MMSMRDKLKMSIAQIIVSLMLIASFDARGQQNIKQEHQKIIASTNYLSVDFEQEIYSAFRKKTKNRHGHAFFAKPNSFRWTFTDGVKSIEEFFFDGETLSHFLTSENTVTHYGIASGFATELRSVVNMIIDPNQLSKSYDFVKVDKTPASVNIQMTPKSNKSDIKQLTVVMNAAETQVEKVSIEYLDGNKSSYSFTKPVQDPIPVSNFKFKNPGGVHEKRVG